MDKDDIIKLAREAEGTPYVNRHYPGLTSFGFSETTLEAFANLVAASEREACAKVCEEIMLEHDPFDRQAGIARRCLGDIRARGNT